MRQVAVDYVAPASEIARILIEAATRPTPTKEGSEMQQSNDLDLPDLNEAVKSSLNAGLPSGLTCPACGGALWEKSEAGVLQYRCHVGHNYALSNLIESHWEVLQ